MNANAIVTFVLGHQSKVRSCANWQRLHQIGPVADYREKFEQLVSRLVHSHGQKKLNFISTVLLIIIAVELHSPPDLAT